MTAELTALPSPLPAAPRRHSPAAPARRSPAAGPVRPAGGAGTRPSRSRPATSAGAPRPVALVRDFARLYLEVECGRRPARQLAKLMDPVLHARLESCWVRPGNHPPGTVVRVLAVPCGERRIDAVVVVRRGARLGALALRLVRRRGRWQVTDAIRPEDGPLPPAPFTMPPEDTDAFDDLPLPV